MRPSLSLSDRGWTGEKRVALIWKYTENITRKHASFFEYSTILIHTDRDGQLSFEYLSRCTGPTNLHLSFQVSHRIMRKITQKNLSCFLLVFIKSQVFFS